MKQFFLYLYSVLRIGLQSNLRYFLILFFVLLYRIEFMPDLGGGFAKILQAGCLVGIVYMLSTKCPGILQICITQTNGAIQSCLLLYFFAVISTLWAFLPEFALFLSVQNVVLIILFVWFFSFFGSFFSLERAFLVSALLLQLFQFFCIQFSSFGLIHHFLPGASVAAVTLCYCTGEYMNMKVQDDVRTQMFLYAGIISTINLVINTSGGANAAAVTGIAVAMFFGGKRVYAFILLLIGLFIFFNQELIDDILMTLMPGKDMNTIQQGNGRDAIWSAICESVASRPVYGWGFACAERTVPHVIGGQILSDAHNSYVGIYGSLGYIGCVLLGIHLLRTGWEIITRISYPGYVGLLSAFACACLNMYTYGFLSGKACSITMVYFMLVSLTYHYRRVWGLNG